MVYRHPRQSHSNRKYLYVMFGIILIGGSIVFRQINSHKSTIISPIPENEAQILHLVSKIFAQQKDPKILSENIQNLIGNKWKNYSVHVVDFSSDFQLNMGESIIFTAASVNKIPILAALYYLSQKGDISMDKIITLQEDDIQDYGTGVIRYDPPGTTYTVKTLARLMVEKSDNTAAHILGNYVIGMDKIQELINSWGMTQTDMVNNKTSNKDMALLFEKIYHGKIANKANTEEMLSLLKNSDFEDRIPALLPKSISIYHKIGTGPGSVHDVGIVDSPKIHYYIGILTSDITDVEEATRTAALISKTIYDFMK